MTTNEYSYNNNGLLIRFKGDKGFNSVLTYNNGRIVSIVTSKGYVANYYYDANGNKISIV